MNDEENSKRISDVMLGVKTGAVKETITSLTNPIANTMKEALVDKMDSDNPMIELAADVGSQFFVLLAFAEALGMAGEHLDGVIPDADEKSQLLAKYIRKLAGEQIGQKGIDLIKTSLPAVKDLFQSVSTEDLKYALGEKSVLYTSDIPGFESEKEEDFVEKAKKEVEIPTTKNKE